ncbi:hypothetical protein BKA62DRAFT_709898 [Auriculariales sp. MPI-PUGE-AT-0066]|nr:hypothetical protein BKA62DRAFT_709898 [Auriculariales sp. MPI-PUGE-AT-0066]
MAPRRTAVNLERTMAQLAVASPGKTTSSENTPSPESASESDGSVQQDLSETSTTGGADTPSALFALISTRERPRLAPLVQPYNLGWRERIESLETTRAVKIALHLLNDDLEYAHNHLIGPAASSRIGQSPDTTHKLLMAIRERRCKLYFNAEGYWKNLKHPLLDELYAEWNGPLKLQQAIEKVDGPRVGEVKKRPLEEAQFDELRRIAEFAIQEVLRK